MNVNKESMLLYAITDRTWLGQNSLIAQVEEVAKAGVTFLQLREKELDYDAFLEEARAIKKITDRYHIPFVINDNIEVALACDADGVHVGQSDMQARDIRKLLGPDKIIGVSARTLEQALSAQQSGADYIGVGAVFTTSTKLDANSATFDELKRICENVTIPVVAIGGINEKNVLQLKGSGADGVSVISAIFAKPDVALATKQMLALAKQMRGLNV